MARPYSIGGFKAGITRLRNKGGANKESLFDLVNAKLTESGTVVPRPGTAWDFTLPAGTKGLANFGTELHVFAHQPVATSEPILRVNIVQHPTIPSQALAFIHYAEPIMQGLYVSAEFANGDVFHYWLQQPDAWEAEHTYTLGSLVAPNVPNGFLYRASRLSAPNLLWAPDVLRAIGDKIEPNIANGYYYEVVSTDGSNPRSGTEEPTWPTEEGAQVRESVDIPASEPPVTAPQVPTGGPGSGTAGDDRYCLAEDQWLDDKTQVADVTVGFEVDSFSPGRGLFRARCVAVGPRVLRPCVRLVMRSGCSVVCSVDTPVNYMTAIMDMEPGQWAFAPALAGFDVLDDSGGSMVEAVLDAGERWVVPLDFGGVSFAGGESPTRRVYTHNMAKKDAPGDPGV